MGTLNAILLYTLPGTLDEMMAVSQEMFHLPAQKIALQLPTGLMVALTFVSSAVLYYFLLTRRKRFLEAAVAHNQ